jgi:hypothetical protein
MRAQGLYVLLATFTLGACIGGKKSDKVDIEAVKANILEAVPEGVTKVDISFEGKVNLVGYTVSSTKAPPGTEVKVTYYWEVREKLDEGWLLFTHVADEASSQLINLDWNGPLRAEVSGTQALGPSRWEVGKVYADSQSFTVPDWGDAMGPELMVKIGIWKESNRLRVTRGAQDGQQAAIVMRLPTGKVKTPPRTTVPEMSVPHLAPNEVIVVDGKMDEPVWQRAVSSGAFVDVSTGAANTSFPVNGLVRMLWDDASMYLFFDVVDADVIGGYQDAKSQPNKFTSVGSPKLWENDTIEIMTKVFHSQFDRYNQPRGEPNGPFGHEDWDPKLKSAVDVRGTLDKSGDRDIGYAVEVQIPWAAFSKAKRTPPQSEDVWRMNFYAMQNNGGVSWSPILGQGNFHKATRFGRVRFVGGKPSAPPSISMDSGVLDGGSASAAPLDASRALPAATVLRMNKGIVKLPR